jgi:chemotaxis protein histidine kinase CheA
MNAWVKWSGGLAVVGGALVAAGVWTALGESPLFAAKAVTDADIAAAAVAGDDDEDVADEGDADEAIEVIDADDLSDLAEDSEATAMEAAAEAEEAAREAAAEAVESAQEAQEAAREAAEEAEESAREAAEEAEEAAREAAEDAAADDDDDDSDGSPCGGCGGGASSGGAAVLAPRAPRAPRAAMAPVAPRAPMAPLAPGAPAPPSAPFAVAGPLPHGTGVFALQAPPAGAGEESTRVIVNGQPVPLELPRTAHGGSRSIQVFCDGDDVTVKDGDGNVLWKSGERGSTPRARVAPQPRARARVAAPSVRTFTMPPITIPKMQMRLQGLPNLRTFTVAPCTPSCGRDCSAHGCRCPGMQQAPAARERQETPQEPEPRKKEKTKEKKPKKSKDPI